MLRLAVQGVVAITVVVGGLSTTAAATSKFVKKAVWASDPAPPASQRAPLARPKFLTVVSQQLPANSGSLLWLGEPLFVTASSAREPDQTGPQLGRIDIAARLSTLKLSPRGEAWMLTGQSLLDEAAAKAIAGSDAGNFEQPGGPEVTTKVLASPRPPRLLLAPLLAQVNHPTLGWRVRLLLAAAKVEIPGETGPTADAARPAVGVIRRDPSPDLASTVEQGTVEIVRTISAELRTALQIRFAAAIGRIAVTEPALARRLAEVLLLTVSLPSEPLETGTQNMLRVPLLTSDAQLDEAMTTEVVGASDDLAAVEAAQVWLGHQRDGWAVVMDDAGRSAAIGGHNLPAALAMNFLAAPLVARAGEHAETMERLDAFGSALLRAAATGGDGASSDGPTLRLGIGDRLEALSVAPAARVRPPGLRIERFLRELSAADLCGGVLRTVGPPAARAQLWFDRVRAGRPRWVLALDVDAGAPTVMSVELWGPGETKLVINREMLRQAGTRLHTTVEIAPPAAGQLLRLAIVVNLTGAGRLTWPRPMLPWQVEPGRLAVDLGDWDGRR